MQVKEIIFTTMETVLLQSTNAMLAKRQILTGCPHNKICNNSCSLMSKTTSCC